MWLLRVPIFIISMTVKTDKNNISRLFRNSIIIGCNVIVHYTCCPILYLCRYWKHRTKSIYKNATFNIRSFSVACGLNLKLGDIAFLFIAHRVKGSWLKQGRTLFGFPFVNCHLNSLLISLTLTIYGWPNLKCKRATKRFLLRLLVKWKYICFNLILTMVWMLSILSARSPERYRGRSNVWWIVFTEAVKVFNRYNKARSPEDNVTMTAFFRGDYGYV